MKKANTVLDIYEIFKVELVLYYTLYKYLSASYSLAQYSYDTKHSNKYME